MFFTQDDSIFCHQFINMLLPTRMRIASLKRKEEHPYHSKISQNPEQFVLVILGTKRGNFMKRGTFSPLTNMNFILTSKEFSF